ncbi:metallophosphoesterase family protein [Marinifilum sp.]|uniref:metallophosphoesterase family protein n=1 Tax=Marinifilum sp. TaxID=2033137 RepID=UPI003BAABD5D
MKMQKFNLIWAIPLWFALFFTSCQSTIGKDNFSFVFITDAHVQPEFSADKGLAKAVKKINELQPEFVLTGGDEIRDALRVNFNRADSLYNLYDSIMGRLEMPLYRTIGNHDVFGLYEVSKVDPSHEFYGKKMFEARVGKTYYSFKHNNWHFIVLDAIGFTEDRHYYGKIDSTQMLWLKNELDQNKTKPIVISTHIPILSIGQQIMGKPTSPFRPNEVVTNADEVRSLLEQYNVKIVLQGHLHILEDIYYNGIHYITGGAVSAKWWYGPRYGMQEGFLKIDVSGENFTWEYIDYAWDAKAPNQSKI